MSLRRLAPALAVIVLACPTLAAAQAAGPGYAAADEAYKAADRQDFATAAARAGDAVGAEPDNRAYRLLLISALAQAGRAGEADREAVAFDAQFGPDAQLRAQRGYYALQAGRAAEGAELLASALSLGGLAPDQTHDIRLAVADAALQARQPAGALEALEPIAAEQSFAVQSRRAFALSALGRTADSAEAYRAAAGLATVPDDRALMTRGRIFDLVTLKRLPEAHAEFLEADRTGALGSSAPGDAAMLAVAVGEDARAQALFAQARASGALTPQMALDAGYGAERLGRKDVALSYFEGALDAAAKDQAGFPPQTTLQVRREVAELSRRWGAYLSAGYGENGATVSAPLLGGRSVAQVGGEVYYRVPLARGAQLQLFARAFETVDASQDGAATGADTIQGWLGAELKPFRTRNLVLEASRMVKLGDLARDDWMLRGAWSAGQGLETRLDGGAWPMWQAYAEAARILDAGQTLALADARFGRTFQLGSLLAAPFVGAVYSYDDKLPQHDALGAGPGVTLRQWFRETPTKAAQSYVELTVQYRARLAGDKRARGLFATLTASF